MHFDFRTVALSEAILLPNLVIPMPLFRRNDARFGPFRATVTLHFSQGADERLEAGLVKATGEPQYAFFLPGTYLDKALVNARNVDGASQRLLAHVTAVATTALADWREQKQTPITNIVPLQEEWPSPPDASIEIELTGSYQAARFGATTKFKPLRAENETVAELGMWAIWDWSLGEVASWQRSDETVSESDDTEADEYEEVDVVEDLLRKLLAQCMLYERLGIPRVRDVGKVPFMAFFDLPWPAA
jgi:hypothetical protein